MQTTKDKATLSRWIDGYIMAIFEFKFKNQGKSGVTWKFLKGVIDSECSELPQKKIPTIWNDLSFYDKIDLINKRLTALSRKHLIESYRKKGIRYYKLIEKKGERPSSSELSNLAV